jgi:hypothetical protein
MLHCKFATMCRMLQCLLCPEAQSVRGPECPGECLSVSLHHKSLHCVGKRSASDPQAIRKRSTNPHVLRNLLPKISLFLSSLVSRFTSLPLLHTSAPGQPVKPVQPVHACSCNTKLGRQGSSSSQIHMRSWALLFSCIISSHHLRFL